MTTKLYETMELYEFHQTDGWMFKRLEDGSVRIRNDSLGVHHTIPSAEWVSVLSFLHPGRGSAQSHVDAERFHG